MGVNNPTLEIARLTSAAWIQCTPLDKEMRARLGKYEDKLTVK